MHRLLADAGVVIEPTRALRAEDFDALSLTVDPGSKQRNASWNRRSHARLSRWENLGSFHGTCGSLATITGRSRGWRSQQTVHLPKWLPL